MASALDVAEYLLNNHGPMDAMKLQKLCYYSEAWHLAWEGESLFSEKIEAWANGPVIPALYRLHRGSFMLLKKLTGNKPQLKPNEVETIDIVYATYGHLNGSQLSSLTHRERPWQEARKDVADGESCTEVLDRTVMMDFYRSMLPSGS